MYIQTGGCLAERVNWMTVAIILYSFPHKFYNMHSYVLRLVHQSRLNWVVVKPESGIPPSKGYGYYLESGKSSWLDNEADGYI